ncbi:MAG TPA: prepilin-type N-terminal cleavage/methylation domain-containing protein [Candidatus Saccharimonadales bacterium]|nr:prepilin-type N-terminal cleavage/methylation domain-containing protein [Candidatus Saccharimonadales bacterium]
MLKKISKLSKTSGFTLIELLVSISLLTIIATGVLAYLNPALQLKRTRDTRRKSDLAKIQAAVELYRADQGSYPGSLSCGSQLAVGGIIYIRVVPCDPKNTSPYIYTYTAASPPVTYTIVSCLENAADTQKDTSQALPNNSQCTGGSVSYTVTNP